MIIIHNNLIDLLTIFTPSEDGTIIAQNLSATGHAYNPYVCGVQDIDYIRELFKSSIIHDSWDECTDPIE